jgi:serine/threonine protein kinase
VVAVKQLKADETSKLQAFHELRSEVKLMSALKHPNIVSLKGVFVYCRTLLRCLNTFFLTRFSQASAFSHSVW